VRPTKPPHWRPDGAASGARGRENRELIADFETDCPELRKPQVMGIAGLPAADQARLRGAAA